MLGRQLPEDPIVERRALNVLHLANAACLWGILAMIASLWSGALYISFGLAFVATAICPLIGKARWRVERAKGASGSSGAAYTSKHGCADGRRFARH